MIVKINGVELNENALIQSAITTDSAGGRGDSCEIILPDAKTCERLMIEKGDTLEIVHGGYTTKAMRIDESETLRTGMHALRATSLPENARETGFSGYEYVTLKDLLRTGANTLGMKCALYGVNGDIQLRRVVRRNKTWPEFLAMVFRGEGAAIKFDGDTILAIGYEWAFAQKPVRVLEDDGKGRHFDRMRFRTLRVRSGLIEGKATDTAAIGSAHKQRYNEQVYDTQQAIRMAKGLLLDANLECEMFKCEIPLDTGIAAMNRIDLYGRAKTMGKWFVSSVTHDFVQEESALTLKRCISTIR